MSYYLTSGSTKNLQGRIPVRRKKGKNWGGASKSSKRGGVRKEGSEKNPSPNERKKIHRAEKQHKSQQGRKKGKDNLVPKKSKGKAGSGKLGGSNQRGTSPYEIKKAN